MSQAAEPPAETPVSEALAHARCAVDEFRRRRHMQGHEASEEEQTVCLCDAAWPRIEYAQFNRFEESRVGADWLWWFIDETGECFGVLIQAKRLRGRFGRWELDLGYPRETGDQMHNLLANGDLLRVPAAYIVYFGDLAARSDLTCADHADGTCNRCERSSVAFLSGLAASYARRLAKPPHQEELVPSVYRYSFPLEDVGRQADQRIFDVNFQHLPIELKRFLIEPQTGARAVAKHIFEVAARIRSMQFAGVRSGLARTESQQVFRHLPTDVGHGGPPYWVHTLRGLRAAPPAYVTAFLDDPGSAVPPAGVRGLIVVHI